MAKRRDVLDVENDTAAEPDTNAIPVQIDKIDITDRIYTVSELKAEAAEYTGQILMEKGAHRSDGWDEAHKCELVESVLLGVPLPSFYFIKDKYDRIIIIDGWRRLNALFEFMDNKYMLGKLKFYSQLNGKMFDQLEPRLQKRIEEFKIEAHIILPGTPESVIFEVFSRVNRTATKCNKQEIRNGMYRGAVTALMERIIDSEAFQKATGETLTDVRKMNDRYLLTRFWAMILVRRDCIRNDDGTVYVYEGDFDDLSGRTLDCINHLPEAAVGELERLTLDALEKAYFYLGSEAFLLRHISRKSPINMNVFESVMYMMTMIPVKDETKRDYVNDEIYKFISTRAFHGSINNGRDSVVKWFRRLHEAERMGAVSLSD